MDYTIRPITEDEYEPFWRCVERAFGQDHDPEQLKLERELIELPRTLAAVDGRDGVVGTAAAYRRDLSVPGGVLPAGHVSLVSVLGTHRRRGILRAMMTRQLRDLRAEGAESIAVLWASEEAIYGRFGYGPAAYNLEFDADNRELSVLPGPVTGRLREVDLAAAGESMTAVYERVWAQRPGWSSRSPALWRERTADPERQRRGASGLRAVLHETDDGCDGYAMFRIRRDWGAAGPAFTVEVQEVVAADLPGYRELWRYLFSVDLSRRVTFGFAAVDEPLRLLVTEPRRLAARIDTGLWLRIVDLPAALAARRYATPLSTVLSVTDELIAGNAGRWRLDADTTGATCRPTDEPADIEVDIAALGAAYLGGTPLTTLAAAGRVIELRPGAVAAAGTAFGWHRAPTGIEVF